MGLRSRSNRHLHSFTLLELLIVLGILAILAVIVLLIINPAEFLRRTRDTKRQTDLQTLNSAIAFSQGIDFGLPLGTASTVYISLADDASSTCGNLGLPALPSGWAYHCVSSANLQRTDSTGWIPINFNSLSTGSPLASLPVDPVNASTSNLYYTYVTGGSWELTGMFESQKFSAISANDGGKDVLAFEIGSDLVLAPARTYLTVGSDCVLYHAYWDGTAKDHSSYGRDGVISGATFVDNGLNFDGIDDYGTTGSFGFDRNFMTIMAWVKPVWVPTRQWIWGHNETGNVPGLELAVYGAVAGIHSAVPGTYVAQTFVNPIVPNQWQFIVFSRNGIGATSEIYLNNIPQSLGINGDLNLSSASITGRIGQRSAGSNQIYKGILGELLIFKEYEDASFRTNVFNSTKTRYGL